ncbi:MAG: hydroxyisourate hydrolase [Vibrio sp.]
MGKLTTHILDTAHGMPGKAIKIELYKLSHQNQPQLIKTVTSNHDGRTDAPLLEGNEFQKGKYQLVFHTAAYFKDQGVALDDVAFLDDIVIRFGINDEGEHYHVPLLCSPYSFSTYRGS